MLLKVTLSSCSIKKKYVYRVLSLFHFGLEAINTYGLLAKREVKMAGYLAKFFFCVFMDRDEMNDCQILE